MGILLVPIDVVTDGAASKTRIIGKGFTGEIVDDGVDLIGGFFKAENADFPVQFLAEKVTFGKTLHLKDIAIYAGGAIGDEAVNRVGSVNLRSFLQAILKYADDKGYKRVRITGTRVEHSSSANPGKEIDKIFNIEN